MKSKITLSLLNNSIGNSVLKDKINARKFNQETSKLAQELELKKKQEVKESSKLNQSISSVEKSNSNISEELDTFSNYSDLSNNSKAVRKNEKNNKGPVV